jgi:ketosteroid isomerase-like protein
MRTIDIVHRVYEAFAARDLDAVLAVSSHDVVLQQHDALPWGGRYVGRDGVAEFFVKLVGTIDSRVTPEEIFAAGNRVVQYGRTQGRVRTSGVEFDIPECHVFTIDDDKITSVDFYIDSETMLEVLGR